MTLLLVGGTGFLGAEVARRLVGRTDLAVLARASSDTSVLPGGVPIRAGDLDDPASVRTALEGVQSVVYCASMGFGHIPAFVELLERAVVRRALFVSTTAIFTTLPAPSRALRMAAEEAVQHSRLDWTILRPTMIYGGRRDRNVARLLRFLKRSPVFPLFGNGRALHQPVFVQDLADGVMRAFDAGGTVGHAYNLAGAAPLPYEALVRTAAGALGRQVWLPRIPLRIALASARALERLPVRTPVRAEQVLRLAEDKAFDYAEAVRDFGFRTRTFAEGVKIEAAALGLAPVPGAPIYSVH